MTAVRYIELDEHGRLCVFCDWRQLDATGKPSPGPGTWRCTSCQRTYGDRVIGSDTDRADRKRREHNRQKDAAA